MLTEDKLRAIITRRHSEGKTLSIDQIEGEEYTKWQLRNAANKYFGGWANARRELGVSSKYGHKPEMTKDEVISELRRLQAEGHSMKVPDFESWFYRRIVATFGGYMNAKKELGITTKQRGRSEGRNKRSLDDVIVELKSKYSEIETKNDYRTKCRRVYRYSREHLGCPYAIFDKARLDIPKDTPRKRRAVYWTDERIESELKKAVRKMNTTSSNRLRVSGYGSLVNAVMGRYGTWNAGLVALGYEVAYEYRDPNDNLTKEETKEKVLNALADGVEPTRGALEKEINKLARSININFGGIEGLKEYCGFCSIYDKPSEEVAKTNTYRPNLTTAEGIKREITRMWYIGAPMNYTYVKDRRGHMIDAVNKHIGSWRKAVESIGLNYADVSVTTNVLSECGSDFEELFAEILTELGYEYIREGGGVDEVIPEFKLKPDFILPNWRWIDCKLSEWTDIRETIIRYHDEEPNGITIVYLRGRNHRINRGRKWKYEHVSVYQFTKQLPQEKREYYENKLRDIAERANEGAAAS